MAFDVFIKTPSLNKFLVHFHQQDIASPWILSSFFQAWQDNKKRPNSPEAMVQQLCLTAQRWYLDPANMEIHPRVQGLHVALWNDPQG